jgi:3-oxoacyl-[acyl-carrier-protein] synthase II
MIPETPIVVTGVGLVGHFGDSPEALKTAIKEQRPGSTSAVQHRYGNLPCLLADPSGLKNYLPSKQLRRMDKFSRLALYAATLATRHASVPEGASDKPTALIVATGFGAIQTTFDFLDSYIEGGDALASPTRFSNSLHNAATSAISLMLKLKGPCATITAFEHSFTNALLTAYSWLHEHRVDRVILGAVDEVCPVVAYCWEQYFGTQSTQVQPANFTDHTAIPGEGAAFFVLERASDTRSALARIEGINSHPSTVPVIANHPVVYLGNDGSQTTGGRYQSFVAQHRGFTHSISPHIGSFPTAHAFDLAAAITRVFEDEETAATCVRFHSDGWASSIDLSHC